MNLSKFPDNIISNIVSLVDQQTLFELSQCNKYFNFASNQVLLNSICISKGPLKLAPRTFNWKIVSKQTQVDYSQIDNLIESLTKHPYLISSIHHVTIDTTEYSIESLTSLTKLLISNKLNSTIYPFQGLRTFSFRDGNEINFTKFLKKYFQINNPNLLQNGPIYENDEDEFNQYEVSNQLEFGNQFEAFRLINLEEYQISNFSDLNFVSYSISTSLHLQIPKHSHEYDNMNSIRLSNFFQVICDQLKCLRTDNILSTEILFNHLKNISPFKIWFNNLETLSLTLSDDMHFLETIFNVISFENLKNFEIKFKRFSGYDWTEKNINFIRSFDNNLNSKKISKISIVYLNETDLLNNYSLNNDKLFKDSNLVYCLINNSKIFNDGSFAPNLKFLNICLNNFPALPKISFHNTQDKKSFIVNDDYLNKKNQMFKKLEKFKNLEVLIIPDFLYNWEPYLNLSSNQTFSSNTNLVKRFFTKCNCENCYRSEEIIKNHANFSPDLDQSIQNFFKQIVQLLYQRTSNLENESGFNLLNYPFDNTVVKFGYIGMKTEIEHIFKTILDNLIPDFKYFIEKFPKLSQLCLGGLLISIERLRDGIKIQAIYNDWDYFFS